VAGEEQGAYRETRTGARQSRALAVEARMPVGKDQRPPENNADICRAFERCLGGASMRGDPVER
jgi:hypothetical protein